MIKFNIKALRSINGDMTQKELQLKTGIRPSTLSALENSTAKTISVEQIDKLCEVLHCQPADLMTFIPNDFKPDMEKMLQSIYATMYYQSFKSHLAETNYLYEELNKMLEKQNQELVETTK